MLIDEFVKSYCDKRELLEILPAIEKSVLTLSIREFHQERKINQIAFVGKVIDIKGFFAYVGYYGDRQFNGYSFGRMIELSRQTALIEYLNFFDGDKPIIIRKALEYLDINQSIAC